MRLENVSKYYNTKYHEVHALENINLSFDNHGLVFIVGKSGSGKSTLLNMISGIDKPSSGSILVGNKDISKLKNKELDGYRNSYISLVFQDYNLISDLNVFDNINISINNIEKTISSLDKVGLLEYKDRKIYELSGGQKQRVAIARSLALDSKVILLDEPTAALDSKTGEEIISILKEISKDRLVIAVTHNLEIAKKYNDRIIEISDGKIINDTNEFNDVYHDSIVLKANNISLKNIMKLCLSNLKKHKVRQIIYILLSLFSFLILGFLLNICFTSLPDRLIKANEDNNIIISNIYDNFNDNELLYYDCIKGYKTDIDYSFDCLNYYDNISLLGYISIDGFLVDKYGFSLEGRLPNKDDEVVITKYLFEILKRNNNISGIDSNIQIGKTNYFITGILDTKSDFKRYEVLKEEQNNELYMDYINYLSCSLDLYLFVNNIDLYINFIDYKCNVVFNHIEEIDKIYKEANTNFIVNTNGKIILPMYFFKNYYSLKPCSFVIEDIDCNNYYELFINLLNKENIEINDYSKYNYILMKYKDEYNFPMDFSAQIASNNNTKVMNIKGFSIDNKIYLIENEFNLLLNKSDKYNSIFISNDLIYDFSINGYDINTPYTKEINTFSKILNNNINIFVMIFVFSLLFTLLLIIKNSIETIQNNKKNIGIMKSLGISYKSIYCIFLLECLIKNIIIFLCYIILGFLIINIINTNSLSNTYLVNILLIDKFPILSILFSLMLISILTIFILISKIKRITIKDCIYRT